MANNTATRLDGSDCLRSIHAGEVDGYAGAYRCKADDEDHESFETSPAVADSTHGTLPPVQLTSCNVLPGKRLRNNMVPTTESNRTIRDRGILR